MEIHGALMSITRTTRPLHVGDIAITPLSDGHLDIPAAYFSNASDEEIQAVSPTTRFGATCWLIETGPRKVLVDAGSGSWLKERFPETGFITAAGSSLINGANEITDIILTHLHADHIGGLIADGQSLFPNATVHLQNTEWAFWTDENLVEAVPEDKRPIVQLIQPWRAQSPPKSNFMMGMRTWKMEFMSRLPPDTRPAIRSSGSQVAANR
jgi:glyoxylase-like metal-dependent hydrolase (beta-lactamase superfamily II)